MQHTNSAAVTTFMFRFIMQQMGRFGWCFYRAFIRPGKRERDMSGKRWGWHVKSVKLIESNLKTILNCRFCVRGQTNLFSMVFCSVVHFHFTRVCVCRKNPFVKLKHIHIISSFYWLDSTLEGCFPFAVIRREFRRGGRCEKFLVFTLPSTRSL
jgi:hypothetical protein